MARFEIFPGSTGGVYFRLRGDNNEPILASERYESEQGCRIGITAVKVNAPNDSRYERKTAVNGEYYFVLKASNGEPLGTSETYKTAQGRETGIQAVKGGAPLAPIVLVNA